MSKSPWINRESATILFLVFIIPCASAENYYWHRYNLLSSEFGHYTSFIEACDTARVSSNSFPKFTPPYTYNIRGSSLVECKAGYPPNYPNGGFHFSTVKRKGDSCPPSAIYNYQTGSCDCPEGQRINPIGLCAADNGPDKGPPQTNCPTGFVGDPINTAIGNSYQEEVDYETRGTMRSKLSRAYNSADGLWRHNFSTHLHITDGLISLVNWHGRESLFSIADSMSIPQPNELGRLTKQPNGWLYTDKNNDRHTFDPGGRLVRWQLSSGTEYNLTYAYIITGKAVNATIRITDNFGRVFTLIESEQHQPLKFTANEVTIDYMYNADQRLAEVTATYGHNSSRRNFLYENERNNSLLTGVIDERGARITTWTFDEEGRALSSEHANGIDRTSITYNSDGSALVINPLGKPTLYHFMNVGNIKRVISIKGEPSPNCPNSNSSFTYDDRGLLKTKTDNKGTLTTYDYSERGLEVSRTEAAGTPQARTITTDWHPEFFLPVTVTEPTQITHYTYDAQGRQLSRTVTPR